MWRGRSQYKYINAYAITKKEGVEHQNESNHGVPSNHVNGIYFFLVLKNHNYKMWYRDDMIYLHVVHTCTLHSAHIKYMHAFHATTCRFYTSYSDWSHFGYIEMMNNNERNNNNNNNRATTIIIDHYGILFINTDRRKRISCILVHHAPLQSLTSLRISREKITMSKKANYVEFIVQIYKKKILKNMK